MRCGEPGATSGGDAALIWATAEPATGKLRQLCAALLVVLAALLPAVARGEQSLDAFIAGFEQKAVAAGISRQLYRDLTKGLEPDTRVPRLVTTQPEFNRPIWDYLDSLVSDRRIADGRKAVAANKTLITEIGARYGVDPYVLAAIWGVETDFGAILSNSKLIRPVISPMVTLAAQHRGRWQSDEAELIAAMRLIQDHGWTNETLVGSGLAPLATPSSSSPLSFAMAPTAMATGASTRMLRSPTPWPRPRSISRTSAM